MKKMFAAMVLAGLMLFLLASCGSSGESGPPPDLTGEWKQVGSEEAAFYQVATITGDTIEAYWYVAADNVKRLYWSGSFVPPETSRQPYTWVSENDLSKAKLSNWALRDETKTFTYQKDRLVYNVNMGNMRMSVALEKQ